MKMIKQILSFCFLQMLLFIGSSSSLYCYQCDSSDNLDCKEYFDHDNMNEIALRPTLCTVDAAAYCIKTTGVWGGSVGTTRFCSSRDLFNQCQYVQYEDHDRIYRACIYTCRGDGCNGAKTLSLATNKLHLLACTLFSMFFLFLNRQVNHLFCV
ncbi:hypothetical protein HELRODRAFT_97485 [Helobdella robusta]|uniref:Protein sleepless n=1 Tax=Helobdella robusta TaxID=6412 RepID=T1G9H2_HELRO|nr:hypothetical protein HELRODRAFT_97485 [Helobdella robusta]ESO09317.1 hypothetical protein HELRODRAFT_97485 [Helobdella robusta]